VTNHPTSSKTRHQEKKNMVALDMKKKSRFLKKTKRNNFDIFAIGIKIHYFN
jgi:hypothetical protein